MSGTNRMCHIQPPASAHAPHCWHAIPRLLDAPTVLFPQCLPPAAATARRASRIRGTCCGSMQHRWVSSLGPKRTLHRSSCLCQGLQQELCTSPGASGPCCLSCPGTGISVVTGQAGKRHSMRTVQAASAEAEMCRMAMVAVLWSVFAEFVCEPAGTSSTRLQAA